MPPTHVFLAFSYGTLRVQFGIEDYIAAEAQSLKINLISHSNIGLCVIVRLKDMRLSRHVLCWPVCLFGEFDFLRLQSYYSPFPWKSCNYLWADLVVHEEKKPVNKREIETAPSSL